MTPSDDGLLSAHVLDGAGGGETCGWERVRRAEPDGGLLWVHLDRKHPTTHQWLSTQADLPGPVVEALLTEDTRPRADAYGAGALVILRGANLNPGAEPDALISIRMWIDPRRIITLRFPKLATIAQIRESVDRGRGPRTAGQFVLAVAAGLADRMQPVLANLEDQVDQIEEQSLDDASGEMRGQLLSLRRQIITLRRYLGPQREALAHLAQMDQPWLEPADRLAIRQVIDRTTRQVEDLDALRDRSALMREELHSRQSDRMNRTMYVLSMVATIFLPLGLITGLLGIHVGGIPGESWPLAFAAVCVLLLLLALLEYLIFKRLRLL
jgi:zinc transporter